MKVTIQCIHCEVDDKLRERLRKRFHKMSLKHRGLTDGTLCFKAEKNNAGKNKIVDLQLNIQGNKIYAKGQEESFDHAMRDALEGIRRQLKKQEEKDFVQQANNTLKL